MGQKSVLFEKENLGTAALKEQNFKKDQKNMESEWSSSERVRNELIPCAGESKLLGRRGGRREVKEYEGYRKLYKIQKKIDF